MKDELDDFKQLWQTGAEASPSAVDAEAIRQMIRQKASGSLARLERNIKIEMVSGGLLLAACLWVCWFRTGEGALLPKLQLTFLALPYVWFYWAAFQELRRKNNLRLDNLSTSLEATARFWRRAIRLYFWGGIALMPPIVLTTLAWRIEVVGADRVWLIQGDSAWQIALKMLILFALATGFVWWLLDVSYGRHIRHLEQCVEEMKNEQ